MRLLTWLGRVLFVAAFAAMVSVMTTWIMVDLYAERILQQFQLQHVRDAVHPGHIWNYVLGNETGEDRVETDESVPDDRIDSGNDDHQVRHDTENDDRQVGHDGERDANTDGNSFPDDALPVWGQQSGQGQTEVSESGDWTDALALSSEDFNRVRDQMSEEDKMRIFSIVVQRVPQEEIMHLSTLMEDGLTNEEVNEIFILIDEHLTDQEQSELLAILEKY